MSNIYRPARGTAEALWLELHRMADAKDIAANGPNPPNVQRDLAHVALEGHEILHAYHRVDPYEAGNDEFDDCDLCYGMSGGVKGNENVIGGLRVCDFCTAKLMLMRDAGGITFVVPVTT
jgi:hypothetical protein